MTKFILVRHGAPIYDEIISSGFKGRSLSLAPLSQNGIDEVLKMCDNSVFSGSELLISSPYTRALQTASIIGLKYNLLVNVEVLLHEWIIDTSGDCISPSKLITNLRMAKKEWEEYQRNPNFVFSKETESLLSVRNRILSVLFKYLDYDKVIVVAHQMLISMLFDERIKLGTGEFTTITSEELVSKFDFGCKKLLKK